MQVQLEQMENMGTHKFPKSLALKLEKGERPSFAERREAVRFIVAAVLRRIPTPSEQHLEAVAKEFVQQYPKSFKDAIEKDSEKLGYESLLCELIAEVENCRPSVDMEIKITSVISKKEKDEMLVDLKLLENVQPSVSVEELFPKSNLDCAPLLEKIPFDTFDKQLVSKLERGERPSATERSEAINIIIAALLKHMPNITKKHLEAVALGIVRRYPESLKDTNSAGYSHASLLCQLISKAEECKKATDAMEIEVVKTEVVETEVVDISEEKEDDKMLAQLQVKKDVQPSPSPEKISPDFYIDEKSLLEKIPFDRFPKIVLSKLERGEKPSGPESREIVRIIISALMEHLPFIRKRHLELVTLEMVRRYPKSFKGAFQKNVNGRLRGKLLASLITRAENCRRKSDVSADKKLDQPSEPVVKSFPKPDPMYSSILEKIPFKKFPMRLISKMEKGERPTISERREVVRIIISEFWEDMLNITKMDLEAVAMEIVRQYPESFKDSTGQDSNGCAHKELLRQFLVRVVNCKINEKKYAEDVDSKVSDDISGKEKDESLVGRKRKKRASESIENWECSVLLEKLPIDKFPKSLILKLIRGERPLVSERVRIVQIIISTYMDILPVVRKKHLEFIAMELVKRYPGALKDTMEKDSTELGHESLLRQLQTRLSKCKAKIIPAEKETDKLLDQPQPSEEEKVSSSAEEDCPNPNLDNDKLLEKIPFDKFPKSLVSKMERGERPSAREKIDAVRIIVAAVQELVPSPSKKHLEDIAMEVVRRYPESFRENTAEYSISLGHESLLRQLVTRVETLSRRKKRPDALKKKCLCSC